jgi:hypothetical protein
MLLVWDGDIGGCCGHDRRLRDTAFEVTVRKMGMSQVRRACEPEKVDDFSGKACHEISVCAQGQSKKSSRMT